MRKGISLRSGGVLALLALIALLLSAYVPAQKIKSPTLRITKPSEGQTIRAAQVQVQAKVSNFKMNVKAIGQTNESGRGHLNYIVDNVPLVRTAKTSIEIAGLAPGQHKITVELNNNDRSPISPPVQVSVNFNYELPAKPSKLSKDAIVVPSPTPTPPPTPVPTPTPTFSQQRTNVVAFLRQLHQLENNFDDASESANLAQKLADGDSLQQNAALNTLLAQLEGYQRQVSELAVPSGLVELADLKNVELQGVAKLQRLLQEIRSAIQAGNEQQLDLAVTQWAALENDPTVAQAEKLHVDLLAKFNIPDKEVDYRRRQ